MEKYGLGNIHNVVLLSHGGAGKTTLAEAMLFNAGAISRLGRVDDGSSTSDYDPDEVKRRISINLSLLPCPWKENKINVLDAPGYNDFVGEVRAGMRVSEGAIIVICGSSGVEVGTELTWGYCDEAGLPRLVFISRMDRENADFPRVVEEIKTKLGAKCVPLQLAIGAHTSFQGVIDLLSMKAYTGSGSQAKEVPVPDTLKAQAASLREKLVEAIAEVDDKLIEKYLGGEEISLEELTRTLRQAVLSGRIVPILAGSGLQNIAVDRLMDAINAYMPLPKEKKIAVAGGGALEPAEDAPLAALVFKTTADPYVGKLTYFRVYTGAISSNSQVWNSVREANERIGQLFMMRGKTQEPVARVNAGDIGAVAKLNVTATGDTLCAADKPVKLEPIVFPKPIFSEAVYPKTKADLDKMGTALTRLAEEDPTLEVHRELDTAETILSGMGDTQLSVAAEKMQRKFGVNVELTMPKVPYKRDHYHHGQGPSTSTRSRPAATASTATSCWSSSRCRAAAITSLPTRSSAAPCPGTTSRPWKRASSRPYQEGALAGYPVVGRQGHRLRRRLPPGGLLGNMLQDRRRRGAQEGHGRRPAHPPGTHREHQGNRAQRLDRRYHRRPQHQAGPGAGHEPRGRYQHHRGPGAPGRGAALRHRPEVNDPGQGDLHHGIRPLRGGAAQHHPEDHRRDPGGKAEKEK